jgi:hypothetical protein
MRYKRNGPGAVPFVSVQTYFYCRKSSRTGLKESVTTLSSSAVSVWTALAGIAMLSPADKTAFSPFDGKGSAARNHIAYLLVGMPVRRQDGALFQTYLAEHDGFSKSKHLSFDPLPGIHRLGVLCETNHDVSPLKIFFMVTGLPFEIMPASCSAAMAEGRFSSLTKI